MSVTSQPGLGRGSTYHDLERHHPLNKFTWLQNGLAKGHTTWDILVMLCEDSKTGILKYYHFTLPFYSADSDQSNTLFFVDSHTYGRFIKRRIGHMIL